MTLHALLLQGMQPHMAANMQAGMLAAAPAAHHPHAAAPTAEITEPRVRTARVAERSNASSTPKQDTKDPASGSERGTSASGSTTSATAPAAAPDTSAAAQSGAGGAANTVPKPMSGVIGGVGGVALHKPLMTLYVGNLAAGVDENVLYSQFMGFGPVQNVQVRMVWSLMLFA